MMTVKKLGSEPLMKHVLKRKNLDENIDPSAKFCLFVCFFFVMIIKLIPF